MFKISIAFHLFRFVELLNKVGNSNMAKLSIKMNTNGTPNPHEWNSGRDVSLLKIKYFGALNAKVYFFFKVTIIQS